MIAVDDHPRPLGSGETRELLDAFENAPAPEQQLADKDEVVLAASRAIEEAVGETVERLRRNRFDRDPPFLLPARKLPPRTVEFAVGREDPQLSGLPGRRGDQPDDELVGVGREGDRIRRAGAELAGHLPLRRRPELVHDLVPLAVGKPGSVVPRFHMRVEARVGPEVVAVRCEMQPVGVRSKAPAEQALEAQRSVLSAHSSGKTRFSSVARRYGAPAEPPVPGLLPMIRSTVSTCLWRHEASASSISTSFSASS